MLSSIVQLKYIIALQASHSLDTHVTMCEEQKKLKDCEGKMYLFFFTDRIDTLVTSGGTGKRGKGAGVKG